MCVLCVFGAFAMCLTCSDAFTCVLACFDVFLRGVMCFDVFDVFWCGFGLCLRIFKCFCTTMGINVSLRILLRILGFS